MAAKSTTEMYMKYLKKPKPDLVAECESRSIETKSSSKHELVKLLMQDDKSKRGKSKKANGSVKKRRSRLEAEEKEKVNREIQKSKIKKKKKTTTTEKERVPDASPSRPQQQFLQIDDEVKGFDENIMENSQARYRRGSTDTFISKQTVQSSNYSFASLSETGSELLDALELLGGNEDTGTAQSAKSKIVRDDSRSRPPPIYPSRPRSASDDFDEVNQPPEISDTISTMSGVPALPCAAPFNDREMHEVHVHPFLCRNDGITCRVCGQRSDQAPGCSIIRAQNPRVMDYVQRTYPVYEQQSWI